MIQEKYSIQEYSSLHVAHGAYKKAMEKSGWNINTFLQAIYYLFKDFPCRRADFIYYTKSKSFPKKLYGIRWVENAAVIQQALKIIPYLKIYIDCAEK